MLLELTIDNLALLPQGRTEFDRGLTVLTGETGAGKSIIVNALSLASGSRADREAVRDGADAATVRAIFDTSSTGADFKREYGEYLDRDRLVVERVVTAEGQSQVTIGGKRATVGLLREITEPLIEIIGQHAGQRLMNEDSHLLLLDEFGGLLRRRGEVADNFRSWRRTAEELRRVLNRRDQLEQERQLLLFQKQEIEKAEIRVGEEEELLVERTILDSARFLMQAASLSVEILDGEEASVLILIGQLKQQIDGMAEVDRSMQPHAEELYDITVRLEELRRTIEQYGSSLSDDPARLEEINLRLDELYNLKKKYGGSEEAILQTLDQINRRLNDRPDTDDLIARLQDHAEQLQFGYTEAALELSRRRHDAAADLQESVIEQLDALAIENARFDFEFVYEDDPEGVIVDGRAVKPSETGLETVRVMFSANPGEPLRSLVKTASGGEISRVLLAIKAAQQEKSNGGPLLVFDEVDVGIGGQTARALAGKLADLASNRQVLVITHLHQIAREADAHIAVRKERGPHGRNVIRLETLDTKSARAELERMVGLPG